MYLQIMLDASAYLHWIVDGSYAGFAARYSSRLRVQIRAQRYTLPLIDHLRGIRSWPDRLEFGHSLNPSAARTKRRSRRRRRWYNGREWLAGRIDKTYS